MPSTAAARRPNRRAIVQPSANNETDWPNPFGKDTVQALELDPMKRCELAGRSQEHGVEYFFPRVERIRASLGHSGHQIGETKHMRLGQLLTGHTTRNPA